MKTPQIELKISGSGLLVTDANKTTVIIGGKFNDIEVIVDGQSKGKFTTSPQTSLVVINGDKLKITKKTHDLIIIKGLIEFFNPLSVNDKNQLVLEPWIIEGRDNDLEEDDDSAEFDYEADTDE
jgi:hypothetical protein